MKKAVLIALAFFLCFVIFMHAIGQGAALKDTSLTGKDGVGVKVIGFFAIIGSKGKDLVSFIFSNKGSNRVGVVSSSTLSEDWYIIRYSFKYEGSTHYIYYGWDYSDPYGDLSLSGSYPLYCTLSAVENVSHKAFKTVLLDAFDNELASHSTMFVNYSSVSLSEFLSVLP